ncbi:hypothetical protein KI387_007387, partial [Taxus chinensis]
IIFCIQRMTRSRSSCSMPVGTAITRSLQRTIVFTEMRYTIQRVSAHRFYRMWLMIPHFLALKLCVVLHAIMGRLYFS